MKRVYDFNINLPKGTEKLYVQRENKFISLTPDISFCLSIHSIFISAENKTSLSLFASEVNVSRFKDV